MLIRIISFPTSPYGVAMLCTDYLPGELRFAYCYHSYLRWCTHRLHPYPVLTRLDAATLQARVEPLGLHVLSCESGATEVRVLVSLRPTETVAGCASKLKGQTSKWLREALGLNQPHNLLGKGYFACTAGKSERAAVERYLAEQGEHHGYAQRVIPPVFVRDYPITANAEDRVRARHAFTRLHLHLVLATWRRRGVFGPAEAQAVAECWRGLEAFQRFALLKVSFVPDHVHAAVCIHPAVSPNLLIGALMNAAQRALWDHFADSVIQARVERLWQSSAYVGSYGELATPKIQQYLRNWAAASAQDQQA